MATMTIHAPPRRQGRTVLMTRHPPRPRPATLGIVLLTTGALLTSACSGLLDVDLPGRVTTDQLDNPALATSLANGVVTTFECAWTHYVAAANAMSDQVLSTSGQGNTNVWGMRNVIGSNINLVEPCDAGAGGYKFMVPLQATRILGDQAFATISGFADATVPNKALLMAQVKTYAAYATLALGEAFCQGSFGGGALLTPRDVLQAAEARFTEALALAGAAASTDLRNMALAGRARTRLTLENFAGARTDAEQVAAGYVKNATRGSADTHRWNLVYEFQNNGVSQALRHTTVAPEYRAMTFGGVADPRVRVHATNLISGDQVTPWFRHEKAVARTDPVVIASYREARLIVAEAAARTGDLGTARQIINTLHAAAGLPLFDPGATAGQAEVVSQVIDERRRELFMEAAVRYADHLRFRNTPWRIPFRGEAGSVHPGGVDQRGQQYGSTTCVPLPDAETIGR
jgi:hypothetical protein